MSKIKWGAIVVDGRGKLGGHVFTKTRSGATMRTKVTPVNPQTTAQAAARSRLGSQSQAWRGLTEAQRLGWNALAEEVVKTNIFGDNYSPSGKNLFTGYNSNLLFVGVSPLSDAPALRVIPVVSDFSVVLENSPATGTIQVFADGDTDGTALVIEMSQQMSAGRFNFDGSYRFLTSLEDYDGVSFDFLSNYTAKFGALVTGQKIGIRCYFINMATGQSSPRFSKAVQVAP